MRGVEKKSKALEIEYPVLSVQTFPSVLRLGE